MTLRDLGFDELAERAYRVMLDDPGSDLGRLSERLGANTEGARKALDSLITLGVARVDRTRPAEIAVLNPVSALGRLVEQIEDELLRQLRKVGATRLELAELSTRYERVSAPVDPDIQRLEDPDAVREVLAELSFFTRTSVWAMYPGGPQPPEALVASRPLDLRGLRRGVEMRAVYNVSVLDDEVNSGYLRELGDAGARYRVTAAALERVIIMDGQVAVVPIDPTCAGHGVLVVRQPSLVAGFQQLFRRVWEDADELPWAKQTGNEPELSDEDRQVLVQLASGNTDEVVARMLGVSVRHMRRRVARLMDRLGANSRFEAGAEATRRGWI
ncbi:hypothetical protein [Actinokineospora sp.]|uniref:hypothetical protein n=1 Tax=Actinokineospora sp. TaxID=1872133 RepID=UPI004037784B